MLCNNAEPGRLYPSVNLGSDRSNDPRSGRSKLTLRAIQILARPRGIIARTLNGSVYRFFTLLQILMRSLLSWSNHCSTERFMRRSMPTEKEACACVGFCSLEVKFPRCSILHPEFVSYIPWSTVSYKRSNRQHRKPWLFPSFISSYMPGSKFAIAVQEPLHTHSFLLITFLLSNILLSFH